MTTVSPSLLVRCRLLAAAAAMVLVAAACGDGESAAPTTTTADATAGSLVAAVASYEVVAGHEQRLLVGLQSAEDPRLVAFGTVAFTFSYLGTRAEPRTDPEPAFEATATFLPIPGQDIAEGAAGPRLVKPSEGIGVYGVEGVTFDEPGFWQVAVEAALPEGTERAQAAFEVRSEPLLPFPGQPAPRTDNPTFGEEGVAPQAVDSRARPGAPDPAPDLHSTSVADAIAAGRPVLVVVSTPVYCQSRFCGPITDLAAELAAEYGDRMTFAHLEVWADFEAKKLNPAAAEWIFRPGAGANEPWVWLVGGDGVIVDRWDNVASEPELRAAIEDLLGTA